MVVVVKGELGEFWSLTEFDKRGESEEWERRGLIFRWKPHFFYFLLFLLLL